MEDLNTNNVDAILERMIRRTFYNDLGEITYPDRVRSVSFGVSGIAVNFVNGQVIEFTADLGTQRS